MIRNLIPPVTIYILILLFSGSCAKQSTPSGGPKDTIPPILLKSIPEHQTINFKGRELYFEFDEKINADKLKQQLIITPTTEIEYDFSVKKYFLTIKLKSDLPDSTTFTFNFSDGVGDITEQNPVENFKLAISTGHFIDSLEISGTISHLDNGKPVKDALVAIYDIVDTTSIFKDKPKYFSRTDEEGNYKIENIKNGKYKIYTWKDENRSLTLQSDEEPFGFKADTINLTESIDSINIPIQLIDISELNRSLAKTFGKYFDVRYSKYVNNYEFELLDSNQLRPPSNIVRDNEYIRFYNPRTTISNDSTGIILTAYDSLLNSVTDTLYVKFSESKKKPEKFNVTQNPPKNTATLKQLYAKYTFDKPIVKTSYDSISILLDTLINIPIKLKDSVWNYNNTKLSISTDIPWTLINDTITYFNQQLKTLDSLQTETIKDSLRNEGIPDSLMELPKKAQVYQLKPDQFKLHTASAAFISIDQDSSKLINTLYTKLNPEDRGIISVTINSSLTDYIVQLVDASKDKIKVIQQVHNAKTHAFKNVPPGKYSFRIINDLNGNNRRDFGNPNFGIEPEPIIFPELETELKANWEVNLELSF